MPADQLWEEWRNDLRWIGQDIHELFSSRRTFRDIATVFEQNKRFPFRRARADATDPYASETWENACYQGNRAGEHSRALGFKWFSGVVPPK